MTILRQLLQKPSGICALSLLLFLYACAAFAPFLAPQDPSSNNLKTPYHPPTVPFWHKGAFAIPLYKKETNLTGQYTQLPGQAATLAWFVQGFSYKLFGFIPCNWHLFGLKDKTSDTPIYLLGSDSTGRDNFSRLLYGAQISLSIGLIGIAITLTLGFFIGALAGFLGGYYDFFSMRLAELLMAIPGIYLLLGLRSTLAPYFGPGQTYLVIIVVLSLIGWTSSARVIRGLSLTLSKRSFVLAAIAFGQSPFRILMKHILPNLSSYLLLCGTLSIPSYILGEAALSFLGIGIQEPTPSWGLMLKDAQDIKVFMLGYWWLLAPGALITITTIAFNLLGDTLRNIVDPHFR